MRRGKNLFSHLHCLNSSLSRVGKTGMDNVFQPCYTMSLRQKYRSRRQERQEYFPRTVWNQLDPLCLWKESWKKRYSRGLCIRVEKISNGQTDPIRRQVGLPKFSIVERDSIFPPSLPFVVFSFLPFFFLQTQAFIIYRETCSLTCFANRSWTRDFERTNRMKKKF